MRSGSSPLTRGKPDHQRRGLNPRGLIPAHAGKTGFVPLAVLAGEGSSPLTRGKPANTWDPLLEMRLIPAHAGKTNLFVASDAAIAAHPRSRGENIQGMADALNNVGSSPLTRGKHADRTVYDLADRLIPAHAGKTPPMARLSEVERAHPRSRGENGAAR